MARAIPWCRFRTWQLERPRAVPDDGAGLHQLRGQLGSGFGADVQNQVIVSHIGGGLDDISVGAEGFGTPRQWESAPLHHEAFMASITALASPASGRVRPGLLPMLGPAASMKVLAMPPPTIRPSTLLDRACGMVSSAADFAACHDGDQWALGLARALPMASISSGQRWRTCAGDGCGFGDAVGGALLRGGRCQGIVDKMSHSLPSTSASSGLFSFAFVQAAVFEHDHFAGVTVKAVHPVGHRAQVRQQLAHAGGHGGGLSSGLNSPSVGRPRWLVTMTAAPASSAIFTAGMLARMRVSSVISPASFCGTFRSARMNYALATSWPLAMTSEKRMNFVGELALVV